MLELRVLTGLHKGGAVPLTDAPLVVGSSEEGDIILLDANVAMRHMRVAPQDGDAWVVSGESRALLADGLHRTFSAPLQLSAQELQAPAFFQLVGSDVWVCISPAGLAWQTPPSAPQAVDETMNARPVPRAGFPGRWTHRDLAGALAIAFAVGAAVVLLSQLAALLPSRSAAPANGAIIASAVAEVKAPERVLPPPSEEDILALTRTALRSQNLADVVTPRLENGELVLAAQLEERERRRLEFALNFLNAQWKGKVSIRAVVTSPAQAAGFSVVQVVGGKNPSVLLSTGRRLYLGDMVDSYRLVEAAPDKVVFQGARRLEIKP